MSAADSLRPRIPAHGTEVLAPSNGNYPPSPQRALFDTVPSPKMADSFARLLLLCALPHKRALSHPTFARDFLHQTLAAFIGLTRRPECHHPRTILEDQKERTLADPLLSCDSLRWSYPLPFRIGALSAGNISACQISVAPPTRSLAARCANLCILESVFHFQTVFQRLVFRFESADPGADRHDIRIIDVPVLHPGAECP